MQHSPDIQISSGTLFKANKGGAFSLYQSAKAIISDSIFEGNEGTQGAALSASGSADLTIARTQFKANTASGDGGALHAQGGSGLKILNATFTLNKGKSGGAIYALGDIDISQTTFEENTASVFAGALMIGGDNKAEINNNTFINNKAPNYPDVYVISGDDIKIVQNNFTQTAIESIYIGNNVVGFAQGNTGLSNVGFRNTSAQFVLR